MHDQDPQFVHSLFTSIAPRYDLANRLLSGGCDIFWRRRVGKIVHNWDPRNVLDVATGSGDLALEIQKRCPQSRIVASDFCQPMLDEAGKKGVKELVLADALNLPFADGSFDVTTVAFGLRNMESRLDALKEMQRVLRVGGHLLVLDFSLPQPPFRGPYRWYLHHILPCMAGLVTGQPAAYKYLGDSIEKFPRGEEMVALFGTAGFEDNTAVPLTGGIVSVYTGRKK